LDDLGLCGFHLQNWWIATNMAESNKEKQEILLEKAGPLDHQFPCKFSPQ